MVAQHINGDATPNSLRGLARWFPYVATPRPGKPGKTDKKPATKAGAPLPNWGRPEAWMSYEQAKTIVSNNAKLAGVGLCMTGIKGIVGIDLDNCIEAGVPNAYAQNIIAMANSYTEISPSGTGVRIFVRGETSRDYFTPEIEVYAGHAGRFLTVTGDRMPGTHADINPAPQLLGYLEETLAPAGPKATAAPVPVPFNVGDISDAGLPPHARAFLVEGGIPAHGDGSRALFAAACALTKRYDDETAFSYLMNSDPAWAVATNHRPRADDAVATEAAMGYLWDQVRTARAKLGPVVPELEDFEDLSVDTPLEFPVSEAVLKGWFETTYTTAELAATEYLIEGFLAHALMILAGQPGVGKTTALAALMLVVAGFRLGDSTLTTPKRRKVLYVGEDLDQIKGILFAYAKAFDIPDIADWVILIEAHRAEVDDFLLLTHNVRRHRHDGEWPWLVLDTAAATLALESENDNSEVSTYMSAIKTKFFSKGVPVAISTHTNKGVSNDNPEVMARGASAFTGDATLTATLLKDDTGHYMRLGKRRYVPEFTQIKLVSHTLTEHVMTRHGALQRKTLIYVVPEPSSDTEREAAKVDTQQSKAHEELAKRAAKVRDWMLELIDLHGEVWMKKGTGGKRTPPEECKGKVITWDEVWDIGPVRRPTDKGPLCDAIRDEFEPFEGWGKLVVKAPGTLW